MDYHLAPVLENYRFVDSYVFPSHRKRTIDDLEEGNLSDPASVAVKSLDEKLSVLKLRARLVYGVYPSIFSVAEEVREVG